MCCLDELSGKCLKEVPLQADLSGEGVTHARVWAAHANVLRWGELGVCRSRKAVGVAGRAQLPGGRRRLWGRVVSSGGGCGSFLELVRCPQRVPSKGMACSKPSLLTPPGKSQFSASYLDVTLPGALRGFAVTVG